MTTKMSDIESILILTNQAAILHALRIVMMTMAGNAEEAIKLDGLVNITMSHIDNREKQISDEIETPKKPKAKSTHAENTEG